MAHLPLMQWRQRAIWDVGWLFTCTLTCQGRDPCAATSPLTMYRLGESLGSGIWTGRNLSVLFADGACCPTVDTTANWITSLRYSLCDGKSNLESALCLFIKWAIVHGSRGIRLIHSCSYETNENIQSETYRAKAERQKSCPPSLCS